MDGVQRPVALGLSLGMEMGRGDMDTLPISIVLRLRGMAVRESCIIPLLLSIRRRRKGRDVAPFWSCYGGVYSESVRRNYHAL